MTRHRLLGGATALVLALSACSSYEGPELDAEAPASAPTPTGADDARGTEPVDPMATTQVPELPGRIAGLVRDGAGHTLAFADKWARDTTYYRVYDREWRPLSPLLRVGTWWDDYSMQAAARGFVVRASRQRSRESPGFRGWIRVDPQGRLHRAEAPPPVPGVERRRELVTEHAEGSLCVVRHRTPIGGEVRSSTDGGRTWVTTTTTPTAGAGARIWSCAVGADRVVVLTGGPEYAGQLQTYDRSSGLVVGTLDVGDGTPVDPYAWWVLPDGTLVANTDRPGIVVATDTTNTEVVHRGGLAVGGWITVLDDEIVVVRGDRRIAMSDDHGRTWRLVDLDLAGVP